MTTTAVPPFFGACPNKLLKLWASLLSAHGKFLTLSDRILLSPYMVGRRCPCSATRAPGRFQSRIAEIADFAGCAISLIVVLRATLPEVVFIGDAVFDEVVGPRVIALPLSLDRPCAVVRHLQAGIGARGAESRSAICI